MPQAAGQSDWEQGNLFSLWISAAVVQAFPCRQVLHPCCTAPIEPLPTKSLPEEKWDLKIQTATEEKHFWHHSLCLWPYHVFHAPIMGLYCDPFKLLEAFILLIFHIHWALCFFRKARNVDFSKSHCLWLVEFLSFQKAWISLVSFPPFLHCPALRNGRQRRQLVNLVPVTCTPPCQWLLQTQV